MQRHATTSVVICNNSFAASTALRTGLLDCTRPLHASFPLSSSSLSRLLSLPLWLPRVCQLYVYEPMNLCLPCPAVPFSRYVQLEYGGVMPRASLYRR